MVIKKWGRTGLKSEFADHYTILPPKSTLSTNYSKQGWALDYITKQVMCAKKPIDDFARISVYH